jgi:hypothetical protein
MGQLGPQVTVIEAPQAQAHLVYVTAQQSRTYGFVQPTRASVGRQFSLELHVHV